MNALINKQVQTYLDQLREGITATLEVQSIILLGSAARDELSARAISADKIELFSDLECLVVVDKRPSSAQFEQLQTQIDKIEQTINNPNPLFHIDVIVREEKRLKALPPLIFTFEMKANGKILYGRDCLPQVPSVNLQNLDFKNMNEILFKRLWALLQYLPGAFVTGQPMNRAEKRVTGYLLCRNALDITTVLLPYEGILLPTYQQRVTKLGETYSTLQLAGNFGPSFPDFLQRCLGLRQTLHFNEIDLTIWYSKTITYFMQALAEIGFHPDSDSQANKVFNEWPISRGEWYNLARTLTRYTISYGIQKTTKWVFNPKKQKLTSGLLRMHQALIAWQEGDEATAVAHLQRSEQILNNLLLTTEKPSTPNFIQQWHTQRQRWAEFWRIYIRLNDPKYIKRFSRVTKWQYQ